MNCKQCNNRPAVNELGFCSRRCRMAYKHADEREARGLSRQRPRRYPETDFFAVPYCDSSCNSQDN